MKKVLITGANGMIGNALVNKFINKYELILVDQNSDRLDQFKDNALIIKNSVKNISEWKDALDGVYCVVHLAAAVHWAPKTRQEEQQFEETNTDGTRILYKACSGRGVERFLFFSSNAVYEDSEELISEGSPVNPRGAYGRSKLAAEQFLLGEMKTGKTAVCIFRPASVYGENDKGSMRLLVSLCRKGVVPMIGNGANKKALLYIADIVQAVEKYIESEKDLNGEIFNVSSGDFRYREMINVICKSYGFNPFRVYIPAWFCKNIASRIRPIGKLAAAAETRAVSIEKASRLLGYQTKYSLEDGLMDAKGYYEKGS